MRDAACNFIYWSSIHGKELSKSFAHFQNIDLFPHSMMAGLCMFPIQVLFQIHGSQIVFFSLWLTFHFRDSQLVGQLSPCLVPSGRHSLPNLKSQRLLEVSDFMLEPLIHFQLIFEYDMRLWLSMT